MPSCIGSGKTTYLQSIHNLTTQKREFDALSDLAKTFNNLPAVVDDGYPSARHDYERSLRAFIQALNDNGRI